MLRTHRVVAVSAAAALTFGGLIGGGIVMADDNSGPAQSSPTTSFHLGGGASLEDYIAKLAANLGIDEATLRDAITKTNLDFLDQAVADGKLTEEQAADIRERIEAGGDSFFGLGPMPFPGRGGPDKIEIFGGKAGIVGAIGKASEETAAFLGLTEEELRTQLSDGKSLAEIAEAQGKSRDDLKTFLLESANAEIDARAADGKLTQEQADTLKEALADHIDMLIDANRTILKGDGGMHIPGFGGRGEIHRFDIHDDDGEVAPATPPAPGTEPSGFRDAGRGPAGIW